MKQKNNKILRTIVLSNIKYYMKKDNMDIKELSNKTGLKENFLINLLDNKYKKEPTIDTVGIIASVLNIPVIKLFITENNV